MKTARLVQSSTRTKQPEGLACQESICGRSDIAASCSRHAYARASSNERLKFRFWATKIVTRALRHMCDGAI